MDKYNIQKRNYGTHSKSTLIVETSDILMEFIVGALLGDGSICKGKNNINYRFTYTSKSFQHVDYVCNLLKKYSSGAYIKERNRYDNRTGKYYKSFQYESRYSETFTHIHEHWYIDNIKHIPEDIILTPLICKVWYIGDGSLINNNYYNSQRLMLYTNCFKKYELEKILLPQLKMFNPKILKMNKNKIDGTGYAICINKKDDIVNFLKYIGDCPFDDYKYKWEVKTTLNKELYKYKNEIISLYKSGISSTLIGKIYNCSSTSVMSIVKNNNISPIKYRPDFVYIIMKMYYDGDSIENIKQKTLLDIHEINMIIEYYDKNGGYDVNTKKGVCKLKNKWSSYISYNGKVYNLGEYDCFEDAVNSRIQAEKEYYMREFNLEEKDYEKSN